MTVQRLKTTKEGWFWIVKIAYMFFAFPFLLFIGIAMLFIVNSSEAAGALYPRHTSEDTLFALLIWITILIPVGIFFYGVLSRRRLLKKITRSVKVPQVFWPDPANEMYHEGDGKYLGIDTKNGTILYIHRIRKGQVDVVGLDMEDWTNREVEGNIFRLYTKLPDLPRIEISTPLAQRWYDTLGAMEFKQYSRSPLPFPEYVQDHFETLEAQNRIHIPRLA